MYMWANFNVSRFDSLSDGWVGTISRNFEKASFKLCVLCLSRTFAETNNRIIIRLKEFLKIHNLLSILIFQLFIAQKHIFLLYLWVKYSCLQLPTSNILFPSRTGSGRNCAALIKMQRSIRSFCLYSFHKYHRLYQIPVSIT